MKGLIVKSTGLWYEVQSEGKTYIARLRGKFKLEDKKLTNPLAVGDWVEIIKNNQPENEWVIEKIYPRKNYVIRQSPRKKGHDHLIASNISQGVVIVTLRLPRTSVGFIDRFLITLEAFRIPGMIIFNKSDIYKEKDLVLYRELQEVYKSLGYHVLLISFENDSLNMIKDLFHGKISLLTGHSGAGKSTLINKLIPNAKQKVKEVSHFASKGVHTTTFAELFQMDASSAIIDSPGIKELGLSEITDEELPHYFPEMRALLGKCRYHNCIHENEPGCVIKEGVGHSISERRYESYLSILRNEENHR
ncbi:MAG: ribosome small subunit-dependent GTPase A [Bacteroidota bacterium]